jgi:hypothetical protein
MSGGRGNEQFVANCESTNASSYMDLNADVISTVTDRLAAVHPGTNGQPDVAHTSLQFFDASHCTHRILEDKHGPVTRLLHLPTAMTQHDFGKDLIVSAKQR